MDNMEFQDISDGELIQFGSHGNYFDLIEAQKFILKKDSIKIILDISEFNLSISKDNYSMIVNNLKQIAPSKKSTKKYEFPLFKIWLMQSLRSNFELTENQLKNLLFFTDMKSITKTQEIQYFDLILIAAFNYYFEKSTFDITSGQSGFAIMRNLNQEWTKLTPRQLTELKELHQMSNRKVEHKEYFNLSLIVGFYIPDTINALPYDIINLFDKKVQNKFFKELEIHKEKYKITGKNLNVIYDKLKSLQKTINNEGSVLYTQERYNRYQQRPYHNIKCQNNYQNNN